MFWLFLSAVVSVVGAILAYVGIERLRSQLATTRLLVTEYERQIVTLNSDRLALQQRFDLEYAKRHQKRGTLTRGVCPTCLKGNVILNKNREPHRRFHSYLDCKAHRERVFNDSERVLVDLNSAPERTV